MIVAAATLATLLGLAAPQLPASAPHPVPVVHDDEARVATPLPVSAIERAELERLQADSRHLEAAMGGELDDHDVKLVLATVGIVVLIALLL